MHPELDAAAYVPPMNRKDGVTHDMEKTWGS